MWNLLKAPSLASPPDRVKITESQYHFLWNIRGGLEGDDDDGNWIASGDDGYWIIDPAEIYDWAYHQIKMMQRYRTEMGSWDEEYPSVCGEIATCKRLMVRLEKASREMKESKQ